MTRTLYGLHNCDTCRTARRDLDADGIDYQFRDVRDDPVDPPTLRRWIDAIGAYTLINRRSTMWRHAQAHIAPNPDAAATVDALLEFPTVIKRPVFERDDEQVAVGYAPKDRDARRAWFAGD